MISIRRLVLVSPLLASLARSFRIGPYRRPRGWAPYHWAYGEILQVEYGVFA